ncbi:hypothetical protein RRG08_010680 [Elysia crispata]|uniref:Uncharacterized protein n=1 Tax=Elysia crispata TaxID=231223 RepID=A0AAE1D7V4_9GAST|nr:hypothetical protein RRG08_010680 [Elysia crispata]
MNPLPHGGRSERKLSIKDGATEKKATTNAERMQSWRDMLKKDPEACNELFLKEKERVRKYRGAQKLMERSSEEIERSRELARARQKRYIQNRKQ